MEKLCVNDLMIGDWVKFPLLGEIVRVTNILDRTIRSNSVSPLRIDEIEPIPLTPEILEKNGYHFDDIDGSYWKYGVPTIYGRKVPFTMLCSITLWYVHELQHALKLCKIDKEIELW